MRTRRRFAPQLEQLETRLVLSRMAIAPIEPNNADRQESFAEREQEAEPIDQLAEPTRQADSTQISPSDLPAIRTEKPADSSRTINNREVRTESSSSTEPMNPSQPADEPALSPTASSKPTGNEPPRSFQQPDSAEPSHESDNSQPESSEPESTTFEDTRSTNRTTTTHTAPAADTQPGADADSKNESTETTFVRRQRIVQQDEPGETREPVDNQNTSKREIRTTNNTSRIANGDNEPAADESPERLATVNHQTAADRTESEGETESEPTTDANVKPAKNRQELADSETSAESTGTDPAPAEEAPVVTAANGTKGRAKVPAGNSEAVGFAFSVREREHVQREDHDQAEAIALARVAQETSLANYASQSGIDLEIDAGVGGVAAPPALPVLTPEALAAGVLMLNASYVARRFSLVYGDEFVNNDPDTLHVRQRLSARSRSKPRKHRLKEHRKLAKARDTVFAEDCLLSLLDLDWQPDSGEAKDQSWFWAKVSAVAGAMAAGARAAYRRFQSGTACRLKPALPRYTGPTL